MLSKQDELKILEVEILSQIDLLKSWFTMNMEGIDTKNRIANTIGQLKYFLDESYGAPNYWSLKYQAEMEKEENGTVRDTGTHS